MNFATNPDASPATLASPTITHRAPLACNRIACISSTFECVSSSLSATMRHLHFELGNTLAQDFFVRHDRLAKTRATFSIDRPPT
jgi:hypothetical protein